MKKFGLPTICNINIFSSDTKNELELLENWLNEKGFKFALNDAYSKGAEGAIDIAKLAVETIDENNSSFHPLYTKDMKLADKINLICKEIYGAKNVIYSEKALAQLNEYEENILIFMFVWQRHHYHSQMILNLKVHQITLIFILKESIYRTELSLLFH